MAKSSVSALQQFVSGFESQSFWLGIDVHKQSYSFALRRADQRCFTWKGPADPRAVVAQVARLGISLAAAAYESGPTGFGLARTLERANIAVIVAAPSRIQRPMISIHGPLEAAHSTHHGNVNDTNCNTQLQTVNSFVNPTFTRRHGPGLSNPGNTLK